MLERSLDKRFQTMGSFVEELDRSFATVVWTEAECLQFIQKYFSKTKSDIAAMLSRIDVFIEPSTVIHHRPFEEAQTIINSRSSNKQAPLPNKEDEQELTALIDRPVSPPGFSGADFPIASLTYAPSLIRAPSPTHAPSSARAVFQSRADDFDEKTFRSHSHGVAALEELEGPEEKSEEMAQSTTAFIAEELEIPRKKSVSSIRWLILGILLVGLALGVGWWLGNRSYLQLVSEGAKVESPKPQEPQEPEQLP
jgi:hypothetical protein